MSIQKEIQRHAEIYKTISEYRYCYIDREIIPDEISPWMSDTNTNINHIAGCPLCKFPLDIRLIKEKQMCRIGKIFIVDYKKQESLLVSCRKNKHARSELPESHGAMWNGIGVYEEIEVKIIASCGNIGMSIPLQGENKDMLWTLSSYPGFFSMEINRMYNQSKGWGGEV